MATERIVSDPAVMLGKPCVAGTRITVEHILRELAAGSTVERVLEDYPRLMADDVPLPSNSPLAPSSSSVCARTTPRREAPTRREPAGDARAH